MIGQFLTNFAVKTGIKIGKKAVDVNNAIENFSPENIAGLMFGWVIDLFSHVLNLVSWVFNISINISILRFSELVELDFVSNSWEIVRDLANMFFIFILLYIAIGTIFQLSSVNTKVMLRNVIIVALLVNFSAFGTKILIDASNILAIGIYNQIDAPVNDDGYKNISTVFIKQSGIDSYLPTPKGETDNQVPESIKTSSTFVNETLKIFLHLIVMIILVFVLLTASVLLLIRVLVFILLIIFSPMALMGAVVPFLKNSITDKWIKQMKSNFIFAPVFMFLLYLSLNIVAGVGEFNNKVLYKIPYLPDLNMNIILSNFFVIGMLIASIVIAKSMGNAGIGFATKAGGGLAFGSLAWAGQRTVGRAARSLAESDKFKSVAPRFAVNKVKKVGGASFDVRASRSGKALTKGSGLDLGKSVQSAGDRMKKEKEADKEYVDYLTQSKGADVFEAERKEEQENKKAEIETLKTENSTIDNEIKKDEEKVAGLKEKVDQLRKDLINPKTKASTTETDRIKKEIQNTEQEIKNTEANNTNRQSAITKNNQAIKNLETEITEAKEEIKTEKDKAKQRAIDYIDGRANKTMAHLRGRTSTEAEKEINALRDRATKTKEEREKDDSEGKIDKILKEALEKASKDKE